MSIRNLVQNKLKIYKRKRLIKMAQGFFSQKGFHFQLDLNSCITARLHYRQDIIKNTPLYSREI